MVNTGREGRGAVQPSEAGGEAEGVSENLAARDERDSQRAAAPLMVPLGATVINNSNMTPEETSAQIIAEIRRRQAAIQ